MPNQLSQLEDRIRELLRLRMEKGEFRQLTFSDGLIDFSSNDYLGLSRSEWIADKVEATLKVSGQQQGSTGSRLLTGNSQALIALEGKIANFHKAPAALLMSSGFAANEGLIETVCREGDVILYDSLVHASIHQGIRLSKAVAYPFEHNYIKGLEALLKIHQNDDGKNVVFVIVESVYSMEGDQAPLEQIAALKNEFEFNLIVDEAHALGVFGKQGRGLCDEYEIYRSCFARVYTFGKALGMHGAAIVGSDLLKDYLVNFCKPFIYSTAPDCSFTATVEHSYDYLLTYEDQKDKLHQLINKFKLLSTSVPQYELTGAGPVFGLVCGSVEAARSTAAYLVKCGFDVRPIVYPTVPRGTERLRISLHSFNAKSEIEQLFECLKNYV